jgi:cellulose biosynthesis protein BcsQ
MLTDFYELLRSFHWSPETVAALVVGLLGGGVGVWWMLRRIGKLRNRGGADRLREEQVKSKCLTDLLSARDAQIAALSGDCERLKEQTLALDQQRAKFRRLNDIHKQNVRKANHAVRALRAIRKSLERQLAGWAAHQQAITDLEGKFWEKPPAETPPPFRPLTAQRPPIIALVNLKGGVGKTTLTANLGATLWTQKRRTLLVDLDNQGSLTALCLPSHRIQDLHRGGGKFVHHLLKTPTPDAAWNLLARIDDTDSCLLAAAEELADAEEHAKAAWLLQPGARDIRYDLRAVLHAPLLQDRFDVMLLDCPPRLSTACINALTACDYVLIPVLIDKTSTDAVPRLLKWLRHLKARGVCPELQVLGVLGNRVHFFKQEPVKREADLWEKLGRECRDAWGGDVHLFESFVPNKSEFAVAAEKRKLAALDADIKPFFKDLAAELQQRGALHASRRPATVRA